MTDAEIFGKLSRIFETHGFSGGAENDEDLEDLLEDFEQNQGNYVHNLSAFSLQGSPTKMHDM
jgi:hypothetical protein